MTNGFKIAVTDTIYDYDQAQQMVTLGNERTLKEFLQEYVIGSNGTGVI